MKKGKSNFEFDANSQVTVYTIKQVEKSIKTKIKNASEILCFENDDQTAAVLRYFKWNQGKIDD